MNIKDFRSGRWLKAYKYKYFLPEKINHSFVWTDEAVDELLEAASSKLGELIHSHDLYLTLICL